MSLEDIIQEYYNQGLADGLKVLADTIAYYEKQEGHYPSMDYLVKSMLPDLIENMPDIVGMRKADIKFN